MSQPRVAADGAQAGTAEPRVAVGGEARGAVGGEPRAAVGGETRVAVGGEARIAVGDEPRGAVRGEALVVRHAWLQKHPSPGATRGEFHWYPEAADRELRAGFVERVRGVEAPAVLWQLEAGRVAWGQVFAAKAPTDGRRYVGLVLTTVEGARSAPELLAAIEAPPPAPWQEGVATDGAARPAAIRELVASRATRGDEAGVVRALLSGGAAAVADPTRADLALWVASIARIVPDGGARRCGVLVTGASRGGDRVAELAATAWREPGSRAASAWALLGELARARGETVDDVGAALAGIDAARALTDDERAVLDERGEARQLARGASGSVLEVLHAWGRGTLDRSVTAETLPARLADLVALRVLARLAAGEDAGAAIAEARWHALLPAQRRTALLAAVAARTASLRGLVEALDA